MPNMTDVKILRCRAAVLADVLAAAGEPVKR